jgi:hypothetical protein
VSNIPQWYYWGWRAPNQQPTKEQAWVYSFDVADPRKHQGGGRLQIFEGGSVNFYDQKTAIVQPQLQRRGHQRHVERAHGRRELERVRLDPATPAAGCGSFSSDQQAVVSIIDVSNPSGAIRRHTRFETTGELGDQFKQTYVSDPRHGTGTYYGIFARRAWSGAAARAAPSAQHHRVVDVTNGARPVRLSTLAFGKPDETVRGSAFDPTARWPTRSRRATSIPSTPSASPTGATSRCSRPSTA